MKNTLQCNGSKKDDEENGSDSTGTKKDMNIATKSSWYVVEWFGNTFGSSSSTDTAENEQETSSSAAAGVLPPPSSLDETIQRINDDNDRSYFLSGIVDEQIYDKDCVFADPFVSFSGRDRFVGEFACYILCSFSVFSSFGVVLCSLVHILFFVA